MTIYSITSSWNMAPGTSNKDISDKEEQRDELVKCHCCGVEFDSDYEECPKCGYEL